MRLIDKISEEELSQILPQNVQQIIFNMALVVVCMLLALTMFVFSMGKGLAQVQEVMDSFSTPEWVIFFTFVVLINLSMTFYRRRLRMRLISSLRLEDFKNAVTIKKTNRKSFRMFFLGVSSSGFYEIISDGPLNGRITSFAPRGTEEMRGYAAWGVDPGGTKVPVFIPANWLR